MRRWRKIEKRWNRIEDLASLAGWNEKHARTCADAIIHGVFSYLDFANLDACKVITKMGTHVCGKLTVGESCYVLERIKLDGLRTVFR